MQLKLRFPLVVFTIVALTVCSARAQDDDEDEEEFGTMGFFGRSPQQLNVSLKLTQGPQVKFGNLGNLPNTRAIPAQGVVGRVYDDGQVSPDARRPYVLDDPTSEFSVDGVVLSTVGQHYKVYDSTDKTLLTGDYIAYTPDRTRYWTYNNKSQAETKPGYIAYNIYSARTQGQSFEGSRAYTGGVELAISRNLTAPGRRVTLSIVAGLSLNGINISKSGEVASTLHTYTDFYSLNGLAAPFTPAGTDGVFPAVRYTGPSFVTIDGVDTEGTGVPNTAVTIADLPDETDDKSNIVNGAVVKGTWKIKGAYFTLKIGPQVTAMLTKNIGFSAGVGVAGSYVGTTYSADESFEVEGVANPITGGEESTTKNTLLSGYYANIDATWSLNERTGLFAGVSYDNLGDYSQTVGGRTAKIDLNSTAGVRGGLSIKF